MIIANKIICDYLRTSSCNERFLDLVKKDTKVFKNKEDVRYKLILLLGGYTELTFLAVEMMDKYSSMYWTAENLRFKAFLHRVKDLHKQDIHDAG